MLGLAACVLFFFHIDSHCFYASFRLFEAIAAVQAPAVIVNNVHGFPGTRLFFFLDLANIADCRHAVKQHIITTIRRDLVLR